MELLTIRHEDFTLTIECSKFEAVWAKARRNVGEENLLCTYTWTDGVRAVEKDGQPLENGSQAPAIFFDNAEYPVWVEFRDYVREARFGSMLQSDNERFSFRRHILAGFLNYGNEIGRSELPLIYRVGHETRRFTFGYEVLSTKLNYHAHWRQIIEDIEREYRMLTLDYMRRTFHGFSPDAKGDTPELIWWSIFAGEQRRFIRACRTIIERPRHRLQGYETFVRADKLKRVTAGMENELSEHRREAAHLYRVVERTPSNDTQENRFLKHALHQIARRYESLKTRLETISNTSAEMKSDMAETLSALQRMERNPFFRTVGHFKGLSQESLVLQRASGYSQVYRTWQLLRRAYSLHDGLYRLQSKDIATLYEIWCFIQVSHIVKQQLLLDDEDVDHRNRMEMNGLFTWELGQGEHSRILFRKDGMELAELVYNPKHTDRENDSVSMENLIVPTVPQKPDIVLQLTKSDMMRGMKLTYLFDAKYRIEGRNAQGVDTPPDDAINQMHRYRDAIYYKDRQQQADTLKKEVIGGYILFPGDGAPADVAKARFQRSLDEVNIGAFPLRPGDLPNRHLLEDFIARLIAHPAGELLGSTIPQKGLTYEDANPLYMVISTIKEDNPEYTELRQGHGRHFCCGLKGPSEHIDLQTVRYLAPLFGHYFHGYYRVLSVSMKEVAHERYPMRVEFHLGDYMPLEKPVQYGIDSAARRGVPFKQDKFRDYCIKHALETQ